MAKAEAERADGIEAVAIVTPNHVHAGPTYAFLEAGVHVICDKPLTRQPRRGEEDAGGGREVRPRVRADPQLHRLSPGAARCAKWSQRGELGDIRLVQVEYPQDWLSGPTETTGNKQAEWRVDPAALRRRRRARRHRHARLSTSPISSPASRSANSAPNSPSFGAGRKLDDNVQILLRYANGARGMLWASQVAPGNENGLRLRVYGTKGGVDWVQANPNQMFFSPLGRSRRASSRAAAPAPARPRRA